VTQSRGLSGFTGPDAPADEDLYKCVHCGLCLNACPTYLETGLEAESPRGRIALMKAVREGRATMTPSLVKHWDLCLQCRACEAACPSNVPYGRLMEATRTEMVAQASRSVPERLGRALGYQVLLPSPRKLRMAGVGLKLYQKSGVRRAIQASRILKLAPGGIYNLERAAPEIRGRFFIPRGQLLPARGVRRARVTLLSGCVMPLVHGPTMEATLRVLSRNGVEVVVPADQGCCGTLNVHAGERNRARALARQTIDSLMIDGIDAIVVASAGCGSAMKEYGELLRDDPSYRERAARFGKLVKDVHEFLAGLPLDPPRAALDMTVTYQDACHLAHAQRISKPPRALLRAIPGVRLVEMPESSVCCGAGGTYFLQEPEMSRRLAKRKASNVVTTKAAVVATPNPGCAIQMENALRQLGSETEVAYVVDLLDRAYALEKQA